ncbi:MAG: hypothetical protein U0Y10_09300 [Spirosomataceae bacterium]
MKQTPTFSRIFSMVLATLLLSISVWGKSVLPVVKVEKAKTEQNSNSTDSKQSVVSELSPMATVAPIAVDFHQALCFVPAVPLAFPLQQIAALTPTKPLFLLSYFQNLFGHHIATNAP